jgi:hypothetical protein
VATLFGADGPKTTVMSLNAILLLVQKDGFFLMVYVGKVSGEKLWRLSLKKLRFPLSD